MNCGSPGAIPSSSVSTFLPSVSCSMPPTASESPSATFSLTRGQKYFSSAASCCDTALITASASQPPWSRNSAGGCPGGFIMDCIWSSICSTSRWAAPRTSNTSGIAFAPHRLGDRAASCPAPARPNPAGRPFLGPTEYPARIDCRADSASRAEQALDSAEPVGEFSDVGLSGALLGCLQAQDELTAGLEAAVIDFRDVVAILKAHRVVEIAAPQGQLPPRLLDNVAVADHGRRAPFEDLGGGGADGDQPVDRRVHRDQRDRPDQAADQGSVIADDRILHHIGQQEDHDEIERIHARQAALASEPE